MLNIGVFYLPDDKLNHQIHQIKDFFINKKIKQKYLDHIAHTTIYTLTINESELDSLMSQFGSLKQSVSSFSSVINNWIVFENDSLTGLNTLCLKYDFTNDFENLQNSVVQSLYKFHIPLENLNLEGELLRSNMLYGFPFVGKHWVPHLTIGSLDMSKNNLIKLCNDKFNFPRPVVINNLGLYIIDGDKHELLNSILF